MTKTKLRYACLEVTSFVFSDLTISSLYLCSPFAQEENVGLVMQAEKIAEMLCE
jgi:hypothetical protein